MPICQDMIIDIRPLQLILWFQYPYNNTFLTLFLLFTNTFCIMTLVSGITMKIF
jgi:hypothetical protein